MCMVSLCLVLVLGLCSVICGFLSVINTLRPRQNGHHFQTTFWNVFSWKKIYIYIAINILLKFVPNGPINNVPALVLIMAWRRPGDKPFSEPMMISLLTHICVTWPWWVNHILHGLFDDTGAIMWLPHVIMWLPQCQWSNPEGYEYRWAVPSHDRTKQCWKSVHGYLDLPQQRCIVPELHFMNGLWIHYIDLVKNTSYVGEGIGRISIKSGHNLAVVTCKFVMWLYLL